METTAHSLLSHFALGNPRRPKTDLERSEKVVELLTDAGAEVIVDRFAYGVNVYAVVAGGNDKVALSAHYDVSNSNSENCQDNTASLCHLIALAYAKVPSLLIFTDNEEECQFVTSGARQYAKRQQLVSVPPVTYCLELTARGTGLWADLPTPGFTLKACPLSDAAFMRLGGLKSACIGIVPADELNRSFPKEWSICHSPHDKIDRAIPADMAAFTAVLAQLCAGSPVSS